MKYYVYIVQCSDSSYYTGVTNDIQRRLSEHNSTKFPDSYIHERRPVELVFCHEFKEIKQAIEFEKQVKGWRREKKQALINDEWELLNELSKCLNETSHELLAEDGLSSLG